MKHYKVTYEIEVDADDTLAAALQVEEFMTNGEYRPTLLVREVGTDPEDDELIDLELEPSGVWDTIESNFTPEQI